MTGQEPEADQKSTVKSSGGYRPINSPRRLHSRLPGQRDDTEQENGDILVFDNDKSGNKVRNDDNGTNETEENGPNQNGQDDGQGEKKGADQEDGRSNDEAGWDVVRNYCTSYSGAILDDDELVAQYHRHCKLASQRVKYHKERTTGGDGWLSDDDRDMFSELVEQIELQSALDELMDSLNALEDSRDNTPSVSRRIQGLLRRNMTKKIEKRKSRGMRAFADSGRGRNTRGQAKQRNKETMRESSMDSLFHEVCEIKQKRGEIVQRPGRSSKRRPDSPQYHGDTEGDGSRRSKRRSSGTGSAMALKKARYTEVDSTREEPLPTLKAVFASFNLTEFEKHRPDAGTPITLKLYNKGKPLPKQFRKFGLIKRMPHWNQLQYARDRSTQNDDMKDSTKTAAAPPPCKRYEFFYSEIDYPWYHSLDDEAFENCHHEGTCPSSTWASTLKWKRARKLQNGKPRRFSSRFIESQIADLHEYREGARYLRLHPELATDVDFPYSVPKALATGSVVMICCEKGRVERGVIVKTKDNGAVVRCVPSKKEFECRDTDIASCEGFAGLQAWLALCDNGVSSLDAAVECSSCTVNALDKLLDLTLDMDRTTVDGKTSAASLMLEQVAERELLTTVAANVKRGILVQDLLLECLQNVQSMIYGREKLALVDSIKLLRLQSWLVNAVQGTQAELQKQTDFVGAMYGPASAILRSDSAGSNDVSRSSIGDVLDLYGSIPPSDLDITAAQELSMSLQSVCSHMVASIAPAGRTRPFESKNVELQLEAVGKAILLSSFASTVPSTNLSMALVRELQEEPMFRHKWTSSSDLLLSEASLARNEACNDLLTALSALRTEIAVEKLQDSP